MAYYSDFQILTTVEGREIFENYVKEHTRENEINFFNFLDVDRTDIEKDFSVFGKNGVKWYRSCDFVEVDNFIEAMELLEDEGIPYVFVRIGEEADDNEYRPYKEEDLPIGLYIKREICTWE